MERRRFCNRRCFFYFSGFVHARATATKSRWHVPGYVCCRGAGGGRKNCCIFLWCSKHLLSLSPARLRHTQPGHTNARNNMCIALLVPNTHVIYCCVQTYAYKLCGTFVPGNKSHRTLPQHAAAGAATAASSASITLSRLSQTIGVWEKTIVSTSRRLALHSPRMCFS